jgi:hypothetical protein
VRTLRGARVCPRPKGERAPVEADQTFFNPSAAAAAADLARVAADPAKDACKVAGFFARCVPVAEKDANLAEATRKGLAQSYGDRALEALRRAVAKGYKDAAHLQKDPALDPLRGRDDFQKLLAELEAAARTEQKKGP